MRVHSSTNVERRLEWILVRRMPAAPKRGTWAPPGGSVNVMYAYLESAYNGAGCFMAHGLTMEWPTTSLRRLMRAGGRAIPVRFVIVCNGNRAVAGSILAPPPAARRACLIPTERDRGS